MGDVSGERAGRAEVLEAGVVTCPHCKADFPVLVDVRGITVCPHCLATTVIASGKRATAVDTRGLDESDVQMLRSARSRARKAKG